MEPWSNACKRDGITNTPLSPYLDQVGNFMIVKVDIWHNPKLAVWHL